MPRTEAQNEALREATRLKIHEAATKLFSRKGLAATNVQEIAEEAQISVGLLYRHYKGKDDIFDALVREVLDGLDEVAEIFSTDRPPVEVIGDFTRYVLREIQEDETFVQFMVLISQPFLANQQYAWMQMALEHDMRLFGKMAVLIQKGQELGQIKRGHPMQMAQHYFAMLQGVCMMKFMLKEAYIPPTDAMFTDFLFAKP